MKALVAADPFEPRLKPITADRQVTLSAKVKQDAYVVRHYGDDQEYKQANSALPVTSFGVVVVRSLLWPGAYSFYYQGRIYQVYLGNGHKYEQTVNYFPVSPPTVCSDPDEYPVGPEPTPLEAPPVEEKAEGEEEAEDDQSEDEE